MNIMRAFWLIILVWNIITFVIMGIDKRKATRGKWRIKERTLFLLSFLLGGMGVFCGMYIFHHKTKHISFKVLVPLAVFTNILSLYFLYKIFTVNYF
ncbi:MAG: DUF1294 domain-containing protein [Thermoanaerobacterium sp.]|nr:DUF1294 domain-containing protein [Thermoanaerobacterium sp.]